jgi:hypothetical protein
MRRDDARVTVTGIQRLANTAFRTPIEPRFEHDGQRLGLSRPYDGRLERDERKLNEIGRADECATRMAGIEPFREAARPL